MFKGPIVIVDDDKDDQQDYADAIKEIGITNEIRLFSGAKQALDYLYVTSEKPFIILSDINMPSINGLKFKEMILKDEYLQTKGIPFVFVSTNANAEIVRQAQLLSVQGFFKKPGSFTDIKTLVRKLFDYWELCQHINNT